MRQKVRPLLCELHAHTTWSDGALSLPQVVDLYGRNGFDALCVTDHCTRSDDPWRSGNAPRLGVHAGNHGHYLSEIDAESTRARREYDLFVVPGLELTYNALDPYLAAHAVAVGCRAFVSVDEGLDDALVKARDEGPALVAAHPFRTRRVGLPARATMQHGWKTLLPCAKDEAAVVGYLRSTRPAFLTRIDEVVELLDAV